MASTLKIYKDGSQVYDLNAYPSLLVQFSSMAPEMRSEDLASSLEDGREVLYARWENVQETIEVLLGGTTQDLVEAEVEKIETILGQMPYYSNSADRAYYLHYKPDGQTTEYRTRLFYGNLISSMSRAQEPAMKLSYATNQDKKYTWLQISLVRDYYWESTTLTDISLSNGHGSGTTGVTVYWSDDGTYDNWVTIGSSAVVGSLPTPIWLYMKNNNNDAQGIRHIWASKNGRYSPTSLQHVYEAESAQLYDTATTATDATYCSNGSKVTYSKATLSSWTDFIEFQPSITQLGYLKSRWFRVLARLYDVAFGKDMYLKLKHVVPKGSGGLTLSETTPVLIENPGIYDLGAVRLPPLDLQGYTPYDLGLRISAREAISSNGVNFSLDCITLMPADELDGTAHFTTGSYTLPYNWHLVHDGTKEMLAMGTSSDQFIGAFFLYGRPITVLPGVQQRLYFTFYRDSLSDIGARTWNMTVMAKYKERRLRV